MLDFISIENSYKQEHKIQDLKVSDVQRFIDQNLLEILVGQDSEESFYNALFLALSETKEDHVNFSSSGKLKENIKRELGQDIDSSKSYKAWINAATKVCSVEVELVEKPCMKSQEHNVKPKVFIHHYQHTALKDAFSALVSLDSVKARLSAGSKLLHHLSILFLHSRTCTTCRPVRRGGGQGGKTAPPPSSRFL